MTLEPPSPGAGAEPPLDGQVLLRPGRGDDDRLAAEGGRTLDAPGMACPGSRAGSGRGQLQRRCRHGERRRLRRRSRRGSGRPSGDRAGSSDRAGRARARRTAPARRWSGGHRRSRPWRATPRLRRRAGSATRRAGSVRGPAKNAHRVPGDAPPVAALGECSPCRFDGLFPRGHAGQIVASLSVGLGPRRKAAGGFQTRFTPRSPGRVSGPRSARIRGRHGSQVDPPKNIDALVEVESRAEA